MKRASAPYIERQHTEDPLENTDYIYCRACQYGPCIVGGIARTDPDPVHVDYEEDGKYVLLKVPFAECSNPER